MEAPCGKVFDTKQAGEAHAEHCLTCDHARQENLRDDMPVGTNPMLAYDDPSPNDAAW